MAAREILDAFAKSARFKINNEYNRKEIQEFMCTIPNAGLQNPTALTYNQWNCGMTFICPLFEIINKGSYRYLGAGSNYTGDCFNITRENNNKVKIGSWKNGEFNFLDNTIESFLEWKVKNCQNQNQNQKEHKKNKLNDSEEDVKTTEIFTVENELMNNFGFVSIGEYYKNSNNEPCCRYNVKKSDIKSLVYALVVENEIKYIGKTIRGYSRPLSYLKNDVMINVKEGILKSLEEDRKVHVLVKSKDLIYSMDGLYIDIAEGYEQALISKFKPKWNNHIRELPDSYSSK